MQSCGEPSTSQTFVTYPSSSRATSSTSSTRLTHQTATVSDGLSPDGPDERRRPRRAINASSSSIAISSSVLAGLSSVSIERLGDEEPWEESIGDNRCTITRSSNRTHRLGVVWICVPAFVSLLGPGCGIGSLNHELLALVAAVDATDELGQSDCFSDRLIVRIVVRRKFLGGGFEDGSRG